MGEHKKNKRPSNWQKHSDADRRRRLDKGGEKKQKHKDWKERRKKRGNGT